MLHEGDTSHSVGEQTVAHSEGNNPAPKTPTRPTQSHVSAASYNSTPQTVPAAGTYHEHPLVLRDRRGGLKGTLKGLNETVEFEELVVKLGLEDAYGAYVRAVGKLFANIVKDMATLDPADKEDGYVRQLLDAVEHMASSASQGEWPEQYRETPYDIFESQNRSKDTRNLKPDILITSTERDGATFQDVFLFVEAKKPVGGPNAYLDKIGQLADYALALRECQPTRTFIPVLFLHGHLLDLLVFTHSGYFKTLIGPVLVASDQDRERRSSVIAKSLRRFWFLLTLPVDKFGFLFDSTKTPSCLRADTSINPATLTRVAGNQAETDIIVRELISRPVRITGRCTYLFNAKYNGEEAILKFSWTPTNRLPEGAIYQVLEKHGISNIPEILASGILIRDLFGYRLEFLVMEHCGTSIVSHFQNRAKSSELVSDLATEAAHYVEQVTQTLTEALEIGILHRDISAGNIAIKGSKAYVIDWGYAKFIRQPGGDEFAADIATRWDFDWVKVLKTESAKDPFTGTPLYMSCRLLLEAKKRSIYDDFESLLYVMLDAFSNRPRASNLGEQPAGFQFFSSETTALARLSCMQSSKRFLKLFGADLDKASAVFKMLDAMRQFLFFDTGLHVGGSVLDGTDFPRTFDSGAAKGFMSEATISKLMGLVGENVAQSPLPLDTATPAFRERVLACLPGSASLTEPTLDSAQHNTDDGGDIVDVGTSRNFSKLKLGTGAFPVSPSPAARNDPLVRGEARRSLQSPLRKMSRPLAFNPGVEDPKGKRVDTTISDADNLAMETESDPTQGSSGSNSPSGGKVGSKGSKKAIPLGASPVLTRSRSKLSQSRSNSAAKENDAPATNVPDNSNMQAKETKRVSRANANSSARKPAKRAKH
ncbi:hypothetical protein GGI20_000971 [Coemansia sp. BCRC 34301]|nr:hypothetical protein GGI20_000971 [Coemansia sp. BCRC 34301]